MFNNQIYIKGVLSPYSFSHECNNKKYLQATLVCIRDNNIYNIPIKFREDNLNNNSVSVGSEIATMGTIRTYNKKIYIHTNLAPVALEEEYNNLDCFIKGEIVKSNDKYKFYIMECDKTVFIPVRCEKVLDLHQIYELSGHLVERRYSKKNSLEMKSTYEVVI